MPDTAAAENLVDQLSFLRSAMVGFHAMGTSEPIELAAVLAGLYDHELRCAIYAKTVSDVLSSADALNSPAVTMLLDRFKAWLRSEITAGIKQAAAEIKRAEQQEQAQARLQRMKELAAVHPLGTVNEIAEKYGLSKSEVRRRKAAGTLGLLAASANLPEGIFVTNPPPN